MANIIFLSGFIVGEVNFNFILHGKNDAIANFKILADNNKINVKQKQIFNIVAFDKRADYCYKKLKENDYVALMRKTGPKL